MLINNRFDVNSSRNEVSDWDTGKLVRLEPRLMKLLCLLIENRGEIVTREVIIKQIWNDYPGADEGLNQSVSWLRKLLHDEQKQIIETLPKTGYCFQGTVNQAGVTTVKRLVKAVWFVAILFVLVGSVGVFLYYRSGKSLSSRALSERSGKLSEQESRRRSEIDSVHQAEILKEYPKSNKSPSSRELSEQARALSEQARALSERSRKLLEEENRQRSRN